MVSNFFKKTFFVQVSIHQNISILRGYMEQFNINKITDQNQTIKYKSGVGLWKILEAEAQDLDWHPIDQRLKLVSYMLDK